MKCIIFDCDGLMFDSERISIEVWTRICKEHGMELDEEFIIGITGATAESATAQFNRFPGVYPLLDDIREKRHDQIMYEAEHGGIAKKGLVELLDYLTENHYVFCIASSSNITYVNRLLATLPKDYPFAVKMTGDQITHGKPNPEIFLKAAQQAKVDPKDCLVLEDSRQGILAAHAAGMKAGFVQDCIIKDEIIEQHMSMQFDNLACVIDYLENQKDA
ncbi:MAG: HAD family phosphatase [Erysipelotrichaceae bacterium]|nr:HAD family phosphatase [Erysipelotrichaceae bacterium]